MYHNCDIEKMHETQLALRDAVIKIEKLPASPEQTKVVIMVLDAQRALLSLLTTLYSNEF